MMLTILNFLTAMRKNIKRQKSEPQNMSIIWSQPYKQLQKDKTFRKKIQAIHSVSLSVGRINKWCFIKLFYNCDYKLFYKCSTIVTKL